MEGVSQHLPPRIIRRKSRGYLAISAIEDRLQIGVTGDSEAEVVSKFKEAATRWRELLDDGPDDPATKNPAKAGF